MGAPYVEYILGKPDAQWTFTFWQDYAVGSASTPPTSRCHDGHAVRDRLPDRERGDLHVEPGVSEHGAAAGVPACRGRSRRPRRNDRHLSQRFDHGPCPRRDALAMALLTAQVTAPTTGLVPTYAAVAASDTFAPAARPVPAREEHERGHPHRHDHDVRTAAGGAAVADWSGTIGATTGELVSWDGSAAAGFTDPATGSATVTYSSAPGVTAALMEIPGTKLGLGGRRHRPPPRLPRDDAGAREVQRGAGKAMLSGLELAAEPVRQMGRPAGPVPGCEHGDDRPEGADARACW